MKKQAKEVVIMERTFEAAKRKAEKYGISAKLISRKECFASKNYCEYIFVVENFSNKYPTHKQAERLEYLREELRAERISYGELHELQTLAPYIDKNDVELLEAAGIPEN